MGWRILLGLVAVVVTSPGFAGLCQYDKTPPGLTKASCVFPTCAEGTDCLAPDVDGPSATIEFLEPLLKWNDVCGNRAITGACWEVFVDFRFEVNARDPSGVAAIGVQIAQEIAGRRNEKRYFAKVTRKNANNKYEMTGTMVAHVPPGKRLDLEVNELCARDLVGNEGCVQPTRRFKLE